ncbi:sugar ABC transporter substrate-binding protein [Pararhizobium sp. YC-54]|uniref:sugar ABC transporter substrate-binding protein n=1 Tax=Pararhizobium sp. YC-54 TaxID=2986920 RepID=UPI0021F7AF2A|nr:sugar ABC transporter substrate-binding protein [Pararhizobium sp. YC-54]MCV9999649.1 sugar ABC transporter substrate-binding protein [Pararhizobium sp. YC-54]
MKKTESVEARIVRAGKSIHEPFSRRLFMQLAAAAGITGGMGMLGLKGAQAATTGKIIYQVDVLHSYWVEWVKGFDAATTALGLGSGQMLHGSDPAKQISQVRSAPQQGATMFIGLPFPDGSVPQIAKVLQDSGIYYSNIWEHPAWFSPVDVGDFYVQYSTPNSVKAGYEVAKVLFEKIGGEGKVVHIWGLPTPTDSFRTAGVLKAASEYPGIELVGNVRTQWDRESGRDAMLSMVTAHPDLKAVMAQNDSIAEGVLAVLDERGMKDIPVVGVDGLPDGLKSVLSGRMLATHSSLPAYQAAFMVTSVFDALNGWKPSLPERMMYTESALITGDNAQTYIDKLYGEAGAQYDWTKMSRTLNPETWDPQAGVEPIDPEVHFALFPDNKDRLNPAYAEAKAAGEFGRVTKLYADQYKTGPFRV